MNLKKIGKVVLFVGIGIVCLLVIGIVSLVLILPSPYQIKKSLKLKHRAETIRYSPAQTQDSTTEDTEKKADRSESPKAQKPHPSSNIDDSQSAFEALTDSSGPLSETCRTLTNIKINQMEKLNSTEFGKRFQDSLLGKSSDPLMESLKPVLKLTLTQPSMQNLISKVQEAQPTERSALMNRMDFYRSAYDAYQEMVHNKQNMQRVLDQSYLTMMLGRAIDVRPDLARDPRVIDYCSDIERILNERTVTDFDEEKRAFQDFLHRQMLIPNPSVSTLTIRHVLQIVFDKTGLHFNGGWIDEVFAQLAPKPTKD